jgi:Tryptophan-rich sensory protein (mitochondrial benzodiazepine receptor homolog)
MSQGPSPFVIANVKLFSCLLLCLTVALIGGWFTEEAFRPWYLNLNKPAWTPPGWTLPMVATPLYVLMGLSLWLITMKKDKPKPNFWPYFWFLLQLGVNLIWSPAFFFYECSLCGGLILSALLVLIAITMWSFHKYVKTAAYLLVPYFVWILFLGILNFTIYFMNT